MQNLLTRHGGIATVAPSMQEIPLENNAAAFEFAEALFQGQIDIVIFMTGVGAEALLAAIETKYSAVKFLSALSQCQLVVRGPKPAVVLKKWGMEIDLRAPEPNTWREILQAIDSSISLEGKTIAIQEYGESTHEFYDILINRGATVLPVMVYRWGLPDNLEPLKQAISQTISGEFDVLVWTSAQQLVHLLEVAQMEGLKKKWLQAASNCLIASIGPTASARIRSENLSVDLEASPPKMGQLVRLVFDQAPELIKLNG